MTNEQTQRVLEEIAAANGGVLRPEDVVVAATPESHPLHGRFDWDDRRAANAHRVDQARAIIRGVQIRITTTTRQIKAVYYVRDPRTAADKQGYISLPQLRSEMDLAREAITAEFRRVEAALERTRDQARALGLFEASALADELLVRLTTGLSRRAEPEAAAVAAAGSTP